MPYSFYFIHAKSKNEQFNIVGEIKKKQQHNLLYQQKL